MPRRFPHLGPGATGFRLSVFAGGEIVAKTMRCLRLDAPAKINLTLRVLRLRDDGFHEITTRMAPVALCDGVTLEARAAGGIELVCDAPDLPTGAENLAVRAALVFGEMRGSPPGLRIRLEKRIPQGAGLGGGSSDAAAVLRGANLLFDAGFSTEELAAAAATLGSDVPFFLYGSACDCSGRGEIITPLPDFTWPRSVLLLKPPFEAETPHAYRRWKDSAPLPGIDYSPQPVAWGELANDLERPVFEKFPVLARIKTWLREQPGVEAALMSGSGSTMAAFGPPETDWERTIAEARARFGASLFAAVTALR